MSAEPRSSQGAAPQQDSGTPEPAARYDALKALSSDPRALTFIGDQLPVEIYVLDPGLIVRWVNHRVVEAWGCSREQLVGRHWLDLPIGPPDRDRLAARVLAGETVELVGLPLAASGATRYIDAHFRPLRAHDGAIAGIVATSRDVTARCLAERALQESEHRFRLFAEVSRDLVAVISMNGVFRYVSQASREILGYEPEEMLGQQSMGFSHPDDLPIVSDRLQALLTGDPEVGREPLQYRSRRKDGTYCWVESLQTLLPGDTEGSSILISTRDVSERRRVQEALEASEKRYLLAVHTVDGVIWEWDLASGRIIRSPRLGALLGLREEEIGYTAQSYETLIHPDDRDRLANYLEQMEAAGDQIEVRYRLRRSSGDYAHIWERAVLLRDEQGQPCRVVGFCADETESHRNRKLMEAAEELALVGGWEQSFKTGHLFWTDQVYRMYDLEPNATGPVPTGTTGFFAPHSRPVILQAIQELRAHGTPFDIETEMISARGRQWWAQIVGRAEFENGQPIRGYGAIRDITLRRLASSELRNYSEMLTAALSASRMSAWHWDRHSDAVRTVARSSLKPPLGHPIHSVADLLEIVHPDDRARLRCTLDTAVETGEPVEFEYRTVNADGTWSWKSSAVRVYLDESGQPSGVIGATQDVTESKRTEYALRESERMLRRVTGASTDFLALLDRELKVRFVNRGVQGLTPEQLKGVHVSRLMDGGQRDEPLACMERVLVTGQPDRYAVDHRAPDGRIKHYEFRISAAWDEGRIVGLTLNGSDITEHILAERAIATQAKMIETMLEGVAVIDDAQCIKITNPAFDRMFGCERGDLLGQDLAMRANWSDERRRRWRDRLDRSLGRAASVPIEFEGVRKNGSKFELAGVLARFDEAGPGHRLVVVEDVSERKQLERAILEAGTREQYRIGTDLHDGLGQELTGISLMLRGIAGRVATAHPEILPELNNVTRLVSQAIDSARALARGLSPVDLQRGSLLDALEGLAMYASGLYGARITFVSDLHVSVDIDPAQANHLYRIAQEAVTNAVRHGRADRVRIELRITDGELCLTITDDGRGLPEDAMDQPGLGLKIMRYRASVIGASLTVERMEAGGTQIACCCPRESSIEREPPQRPAVRRRHRKRKSANNPQ